MNSQTTQNRATNPADEATIRAFPHQMIDAWNKGSGEDFAAPFAENADFVAFEGTHLKGRQEIASFHQQLFDTSVKGTRLEGEVKFVNFLDPQLAIMHAVARVALPGRVEPSPSRNSMQLFVVMKRDGDWRVEGLLNARMLTIERQFFLDDFDSLPAEAQSQVTNLVASLKQLHPVEKKPAST
ncbi:SgcJ/EcaC family oxidoreductase [Chlorogloeopsis fritschii PCC 9212]|uniref:Uncharacterized protein n=1 Tax=Chlorogloeopsis fritschii PCC 6912 TaxID=211165 RepID=A0A3S0XN06_CHLFR|nr:SgcJ/EcaC family oxidoreductase [Chlorogloeopsis fritschii]RUR76488.1 hypothetical protein PCC6912_42760 [Chlorogloeopsis fritschii PCC 6912]